ncbi:Acriflavin resistance protein [hydrothermal vent metagenome]|uniref:Acriflavin resistance protein n=1 Tax=hydrothermal vent metagenome TaxID=652676 RepID=A0A3B0UQK3_9ZZZZ
MQLTKSSLKNRVAVVVAVLLVAIFGYLSLIKLPIQLAPNVERPAIGIDTSWRGAAPQEIESEILEPQEKVFQGLPGLTEMSSTASSGSGSIVLEFSADMDMQRALVEVINRLNQVSTYPVDATEPRVNLGAKRFGGNPIAWFSFKPLAGNDHDIATYQDFINDNVVPRIEQIKGVTTVASFGGRPYELRITFDPFKLATLGIDLTQFANLNDSFRNVSAGTKDVGKRKYTIRYAGKYDASDLGDMILQWRDGKPVYLRDVAKITMQMQDIAGSITQSGEPAIVMNVIPEAGVNVLDVMDKLKASIKHLQAGLLKDNGLSVEQLYDESIYTKSSITMVQNNLLLGMFLAIAILWFFLKRAIPALIVAIAIPICLLASFIAMDILGRSLNIISLAGLAFATGMVLDAAIVVLENIVRQREKGLTATAASLLGTTQVWAALLASTATTVAIFLPIIFLQDESGQLFADLAVTISVSIVVSLIVAVTVLPAAASKWIKGDNFTDHHYSLWENVADFITRITNSRKKQISWILGLTIVPIMLAYIIVPPADYLPSGKRTQSFGFLVAQPGLSVQSARQDLVDVINQRLQPYLTGEKQPKIKNYFLGLFGRGAFLGVRAENIDEVDELLEIVNGYVLQDLPDTFGFARRAPIFRGIGGARQINVDLQGGDYEKLLDVGAAAFGKIKQLIPDAQVRPSPSLEYGEPELLIQPDDRALAEAGWSRTQLSGIIRSLGNGNFVGEYFNGTRRYNVILRNDEWLTPEELENVPLFTASSEILALGDLAAITRTAGPSEIQRLDRLRTLTLQVSLPDDVPLETGMQLLQAELTPMLKNMLPENSMINYRGTAESLTIALKSLTNSFLLAIVILYLLISAMFQSFKDSLLVIMTIPMATVGGIIAIRLMNLAVGQQMDLLTMIGFIILLGLVVNNAILLVDRARMAMADGMGLDAAVKNAVLLRIRPILMSTLTSIFGMLPLLLIPGSGTELYRGLAGVIVGGMFLSTLFTLILLPSLLKLFSNNLPNMELKNV